ncbi:MAG: TonB family protein [Arenibacterium sp.]
MIKRSARFALAFLVVSLLIHVTGIGLLLSPSGDLPDGGDRPPETISLGNSFDQVADAELAPVEPQEQVPVEAQDATAPTSEALVASPDPQQTLSPGTGGSARSSVTAPVTPDVSTPSEPGLPQPAEATQDSSENASVTASVDVETQAATPPPDPVIPEVAQPTEPAPAPLLDQNPGVSESVNVAPPVPAETPTVTQPVQTTPSPEESPVTQPVIAESPAPETEAAPIPVSPQTSDVVIAALPEALAPAQQEVTPPVESQDGEPGETQQGGAVTRSPRPPVRARDLSQREPENTWLDNAFESLQFPTQTVESPLTTFSRTGVNVFAGQAGNSGSGAGQGSGNATTTNYAGLVLVHLNNKDPVAVSARGWARVTFVISPDGSLADVYIIDGSGSPQIDRAAKEQVRRGAPFPKPPGGESRLLTFVYRLN